MNRLAWFLAGVGTTLLSTIVALGVFLKNAEGFSAKQPPTYLETWLAGQLLSNAMPGSMRSVKNPLSPSDQVLAEGRAHWADHCAGCHANDGSGDTQMGRNSYPPAPDMRLASTQNKTDGELFFVIQNGVRMTAMPAWGGSSHDAEDSWKLVHFIRHLPQLSADEKAQMETLNPKSAEDRKEEDEENKFLQGDDSHAPKTSPHHQ